LCWKSQSMFDNQSNWIFQEKLSLKFRFENRILLFIYFSVLWQVV
jgi:hypothetical protein